MPWPPCAYCNWRPDVPSRLQLALSFRASLHQACVGQEGLAAAALVRPRLAQDSVRSSRLSFLSSRMTERTAVPTCSHSAVRIVLSSETVSGKPGCPQTSEPPVSHLRAGLTEPRACQASILPFELHFHPLFR